MTAPWLRRRSKADERRRIVVLSAIGLHFLIALVLGFTVLYADEWLGGCYYGTCDVGALTWVVYSYIVFDGVVFLGTWAVTMILEPKGWKQLNVPAVGVFLTIAGAIAALWLAVLVLRGVVG